MPITSYAQIKRFCKLCEAMIPEPLAEAMEALDGDEAGGVRARRRLRGAPVRGAARRRRARNPLLHAQQGARDAGDPGRAEGVAAVGARASPAGHG